MNWSRLQIMSRKTEVRYLVALAPETHHIGFNVGNIIEIWANSADYSWIPSSLPVCMNKEVHSRFGQSATPNEFWVFKEAMCQFFL